MSKHIKYAGVVLGFLILVTPSLFANGGAEQPSSSQSSQTATMTAGSHQAPMLADLVKAGKLPPLKDRLPVDPLVIKPVSQIGQYGGTLYTDDTSLQGFGTDLHVIGFEPPLATNPDSSVGPNIIESYEKNADATVWTLHLRKGLKWSDGVPVTMDDMLYWWNDVVNNKDLVTSVYVPAFQGMKIDKVDDFTVKITLAAPTPHFDNLMAQQWGYLGKWFSPAHYLKQYNPMFTDKTKLLADAKKGGYDNIMDYYNSIAGWAPHPTHVGTPTYIAYELVQKSPETWVWSRNPYYFKVDTAGNQLPYIDKVVAHKVSDAQTIQGQVISGQVDIEVWTNSLKSYPLYKKSEQAGHFKTLLWQSTRGAEVMYMPNETTKDPVLRKIFQDARFRQALSLAINRDEINTQLYFGKAVPRQFTLSPNSKYYEPQWATAYENYDPAKANQLLDSMGLTKRDSAGFRLMPNGKRLAFTIQYWPDEPAEKTPMSELIKGYWAKIGVDVILQSQARNLNSQRASSNDIEFNIWQGGGTTDSQWINTAQPPLPGGDISWATAWAQWYSTGGKQGEQPPADMMKYFQLGKELQTATDPNRIAQIAKTLWQAQADNVWTIGTVGMAPYPIIISDRLHNVPEKGYWGNDLLWLHAYHPEQFYLSPQTQGQ